MEQNSSNDNSNKKPSQDDAKQNEPSAPKKFNVNIPDTLNEEDAANMSSSKQQGSVKKRKRRSYGSHIAITMIKVSTVICVSVLLSLFILITLSDMLGIAKADNVIDVTIPKTASVSDIANTLQKDGVIRSAFVFKLYLNLKKNKLGSGTFTLNSNMGYKDIIDEMNPNKKTRAVVKVTIPEGYTIQKVAELLQKSKVCSSEDFLTAAANKSVQFDFASQIPDNTGRYYRLEGYIFPDTYQFYVNQSASSVVNKFLSNFDSRLSGDFRKKITSSGMTMDQVITLASIIQTEASNVTEMPNVSSVFHNRLEKGVGKGMLLQSDATIFYAKHNTGTSLTAADIELDSPYNTYKYQGLPPGAICNPGLEAIDAALSPAKTNYFYFVSDKDGKYYYAETYTEHLANVKKALKTGKAGGTTVTS